MTKVSETKISLENPKEFRCRSFAKINLCLHIVGKRNGYHELNMILSLLKLADDIAISRSANGKHTVEFTGKYASKHIDSQDNSIITSLSYLEQNAGMRGKYRVQVDKNIPVGSGMGGGSTNAAAVILAINKIETLMMSKEQMVDCASQIGTDAVACLKMIRELDASLKLLEPQSCDHRYALEQQNKMHGFLANEIETEIYPIEMDCRDWIIVLVSPNIHSSAGDAYRKFASGFKGSDPFIPSLNDKESIIDFSRKLRCDLDFLSSLTNDLTIPVANLIPEISDILDVLLQQDGCKISRMTGSGSTCFGIFTDPISAEKASQSLKSTLPNTYDIFITEIL
uniref:4-(cytidine 5'-diphospho)-2-C-methyl-D-erythritol kinase n=1 Tax=Amphimedon queenslandica TaxID=400682 RepID=A0A1X7U4W7_AMPQE